jgi:hypothetical protein
MKLLLAQRCGCPQWLAGVSSGPQWVTAQDGGSVEVGSVLVGAISCWYGCGDEPKMRWKGIEKGCVPSHCRPLPLPPSSGNPLGPGPLFSASQMSSRVVGAVHGPAIPRRWRPCGPGGGGIAYGGVVGWGGGVGERQGRGGVVDGCGAGGILLTVLKWC